MAIILENQIYEIATFYYFDVTVQSNNFKI